MNSILRTPWKPLRKPTGGLFCTLLILGYTSVLRANQVALSAFTAGTTTESFEGINTSVFNPVNPSLTLPSGAVMIDASSNTPAIEDGRFGVTGAYGSSPITPVPDGTAFAVTNTLPGSSLEFTFPTNELRVGAFVAFTSNNVGLITLSAYDASNNLLETISVPSVNLPDWPGNFVGIENAGGIRRVDFSSNISTGMVLDELKFQAAPEPGTLALALLALVGGVAHFRFRRGR